VIRRRRPVGLNLDAASLPQETLSRAALTRELFLHRRRPRLLSWMVDTLEARRARRGVGWSRPWNREGHTVFRTHQTDLRSDIDYIDAARRVLFEVRARVPGRSWAFVEDLLEDPAQVGLTFYHNRVEGFAEYEGLTISFGRKARADRRRLDRLDLILEDRRDGSGAVDGRVDRLRVFICPWETWARRESCTLDVELSDARLTARTCDLYALAVRRYHAWKRVESRQWSTRGQRYVSYFGPRRFIPRGSSFT